MINIDITYSSKNHNGIKVQTLLEMFAKRTGIESYYNNWRTLQNKASFATPNKKDALEFYKRIKRSKNKNLQDIDLKIRMTDIF